MNPLRIFSIDKSFSLPVIGNIYLNRFFLHIYRILLSNFLLAGRRLFFKSQLSASQRQQFKDNGFFIINNFLNEEEFLSLQKEIKQYQLTVDTPNPASNKNEKGFGKKKYFNAGFDRYDGSTLNRFYDIPNTLTHCKSFINNNKLKRLTCWASGSKHQENKYSIYHLLHGEQSSNPDSQKLLHRDTFHSAIKLWYFIDDVSEQQGPFNYMPTSHRMTLKRLKWEYFSSINASKSNAGGAFRIDEATASNIYNSKLTSFPVAKNTLIIADIRGFHCRGQAQKDQQRLSIYANIRPHPFLPLPV